MALTAGCGGCCCCGFLLLLGVVLLVWLVIGCVGGTVLCCLLFGLRFDGGLVLIVLDGCFYGWWCVCWYMLPPWVSYSGFLRICLFWMLAC